MSTNKQALLKKLNRRLNDAFGFQRTSGGKHTTISLSIDECKSVLVALDELEAKDKRNAELEDLLASEIKSWMQRYDSANNRREAAEKRIAELEAREETLRPVGVMSEKAFHRLEGSASRFIALWPRPGIYLPRKRPEDGVIVYARTAGITVKGDSE